MTDRTLSAAELDAYDEMCRNKRLLCDPSIHIHVERMECLLAAARRTEAAERKVAICESLCDAVLNEPALPNDCDPVDHGVDEGRRDVADSIRRALAED